MSEQVKRYRGQRGPNKIKKEALVHMSIRLPKDVVDYYGRSSIRIREALMKQMAAE